VNKKVLVIAVALMAVAMLATPLFGTVSACGQRKWGQATEKIPVTFGGIITPSPPEVWGRCGNWYYGRGGTLSYDKFAIIATGVGALLTQGSSLWTANYIVNANNGKGVLCWKVVVTFPASALYEAGGGFEGYVTQFGEFSVNKDTGSVSQNNGCRYGVLRGTGDYEGWKLVISGETTDGETTFENYLYKPLP